MKHQPKADRPLDEVQDDDYIPCLASQIDSNLELCHLQDLFSLKAREEFVILDKEL